jgi:hypothetical protein
VQRVVRADQDRDRAVADHLAVVEHRRSVVGPVVAGRAADHRDLRAGHPVDAGQQALHVAGQAVGQHQQGAVRGPVRPGRVEGRAGEPAPGRGGVGADAPDRGGGEPVDPGAQDQHADRAARRDELPVGELPAGGGADQRGVAGDGPDPGQQRGQIVVFGGVHEDQPGGGAVQPGQRGTRGGGAGRGGVVEAALARP